MSSPHPRLAWIALTAATVEVPRPGGGWRRLLESVDLRLERGEARSLLGISGAGKSVASRLLVGLAPRGARLGGALAWETDGGEEGAELVRLFSGDPPAAPPLAVHWGRSIAHVPQGGIRNLNPALSVAVHLERASRRTGTGADGSRCLELLRECGFDDPRRLMSLRPAALSEGMARRVLIALALIGEPDLMILDEPTTGLDSERRRKIVALLTRLRERHGFGLLMVTHEVEDALVLTDTATVLADGRVVEDLDIEAGGLRGAPRSPAARELVDAWRWHTGQDDPAPGRTP